MSQEIPAVKPGDIPQPQHPEVAQAHQAHSHLVGEWMKDFHKQENAPFKDDNGKYMVKRGDTVWTIARRALEHAHHDDPKYHPSNKEILGEEKRIIAANHLRNPNLIKPGEKLTIPGAEAPVKGEPKAGGGSRAGEHTRPAAPPKVKDPGNYQPEPPDHRAAKVKDPGNYQPEPPEHRAAPARKAEPGKPKADPPPKSDVDPPVLFGM